MRLSIKHFLAALVLILVLPISIEWRLLLWGESTTATIGLYDPKNDPNPFTVDREQTFAAIFYYQNQRYQANVGSSKDYVFGEPIEVLFLATNPNKNLVYTWGGIYHGWNVAFTGILLVFWLVGLLAFAQSGKQSAA